MRTTLMFLGAFAVASAHAAGFKLESPDVKANATMDKKFEANVFGCSGENKSPALKWSGAPKDTKSFVVTVYDPDAPTGSGFWHWFVYNIPATVTELPANAGAQGGANLPKGAAMNRIDYGFAAWGGACPPPGDKPHRYVFTVYSLKTDKLDLPPDATAAVAGFMTNMNKIASATFTAKYGRPADKKK
ncbi:YbhB/YbcL family Raf kinase inhibitor-like protein [Ramlibacter sp. PS4R-6]|uniref:YbhB/YbcL family Raf kinase inhibitor-like protein n=1 Tax=Ramlibacter sp. PS4R-6 TaxID=3133438 RepID=UPI0030B4E4F3